MLFRGKRLLAKWRLEDGQRGSLVARPSSWGVGLATPRASWTSSTPSPSAMHPAQESASVTARNPLPAALPSWGTPPTGGALRVTSNRAPPTRLQSLNNKSGQVNATQVPSASDGNMIHPTLPNVPDPFDLFDASLVPPNDVTAHARVTPSPPIPSNITALPPLLLPEPSAPSPMS
jgi:hypothetical protein